jgi:hypothetical protein
VLDRALGAMPSTRAAHEAKGLTQPRLDQIEKSGIVVLLTR